MAAPASEGRLDPLAWIPPLRAQSQPLSRIRNASQVAKWRVAHTRCSALGPNSVDFYSLDPQNPTLQIQKLRPERERDSPEVP